MVSWGFLFIFPLGGSTGGCIWGPPFPPEVELSWWAGAGHMGASLSPGGGVPPALPWAGAGGLGLGWVGLASAWFCDSGWLWAGFRLDFGWIWLGLGWIWVDLACIFDFRLLLL